MKIPFLDLKAQYYSIKEEIDKAISCVIQDSAFVGGQYVRTFEENFANYIDVRNCIGVGNGTDALYIALIALGVNATGPAVEWLSEYLGQLNTRQELGDTSTDSRVVRATIRAAGATGDRRMASELFRVKFSGYASGVVREADRALELLSN